MRFSIHKRIEGGATRHIAPPSIGGASFSIHKRIEGGATCRWAGGLVGCAGVSVSTSGSKGVQLGVVVVVAPPDVGFSIHKRIEGGATPLY